MQDVLERLAQAALQRVVGAVGGFLAFQVFGRDRGAPEDEFVAVVAPVQHRAGHRVVEGLGALGLAVLVQQRDVGQLDRRPEGLVDLGLGKAVEDPAHRLLDPRVVHLDALAREQARGHPVPGLEVPLRLARGVAEQPVVPVEAGEDRARDLRGPAVTGPRAAAGPSPARFTPDQAAFFACFDLESASSPKNCSSSVEPCSAVVEALPAVTTCVIWSK